MNDFNVNEDPRRNGNAHTRMIIACVLASVRATTGALVAPAPVSLQAVAATGTCASVPAEGT